MEMAMEYKSKGIRISDKKKRIVEVELNTILKELYEGAAYSWAIHVFQINGYKGIDFTVVDWQNRIKGPSIDKKIGWPELCALGNDVFQFIELILVGSKNPENNRWIQEPKEMYETPDVYIEMFDSSYWEVFSKDHDFINRLAHKFKDVELLEPDFLDKEKS